MDVDDDEPEDIDVDARKAHLRSDADAFDDDSKHNGSSAPSWSSATASSADINEGIVMAYVS
jgi:hypothetical protein